MIRNLCLSILFAACTVGTAQAEIITFTNAGGLGVLLDEIAPDDIGNPAATVSGFSVDNPGLSLTVEAIGGRPGTGFDLNATASQFGVNSGGTGGGDDTSLFDAEVTDATPGSPYIESVTFSFGGLGAGETVLVNQVDFTTFTSGESFEFGSADIEFSNLNSSVYDFPTPLSLASGESFTLTATAGSIGIEAFDITVSAVPEPGSLALLSLAGLTGLGLTRRRKA